jgi:hypothetical protein
LHHRRYVDPASGRNVRISDFALTQEDRAEIARSRTTGEGRAIATNWNRIGPHGRIMRYNQNEANQKPAA